MSFETIINESGLHIVSLLVGFASGVIPVIYAEANLLIIPAVSRKSQLLPIAIITATGHMFAKAVLYYAGRGALKIPIGKYQERVISFNHRLSQLSEVRDPLILLSAASGYPPFYLVSISAGVFRLNFAKFFAIG